MKMKKYMTLTTYNCLLLILILLGLFAIYHATYLTKPIVPNFPDNQSVLSIS